MRCAAGRFALRKEPYQRPKQAFSHCDMALFASQDGRWPQAACGGQQLVAYLQVSAQGRAARLRHPPLFPNRRPDRLLSHTALFPHSSPIYAPIPEVWRPIWVKRLLKCPHNFADRPKSLIFAIRTAVRRETDKRPRRTPPPP